MTASLMRPVQDQTDTQPGKRMGDTEGDTEASKGNGATKGSGHYPTQLLGYYPINREGYYPTH